MVLSQIHLRCAMKGTPGVTHLCTFSCPPPAVCPCSHLSWRILRRGGPTGRGQAWERSDWSSARRGAFGSWDIGVLVCILHTSHLLGLLNPCPSKDFCPNRYSPLPSPASRNPHASFLFSLFSLWCLQKVTSLHRAHLVAS